MEMDKWTERTERVTAFFENNEYPHLQPLVEMQISAGNNADSDDVREKFWEAIRATLGSLGEKSPIRRGAGTSLTAEQAAVVENAKNRIHGAFADITEFDLIRVIFPQSTKMGFYADADAYAEHMTQKAYTNLRKALKENRWDGTMDGLLNIEAPIGESEENEEATE